MPLAARTRRGGNRATQHSVSWGRPKPSTPTKVFTPHAGDDGRICPTCKNKVGIRQDGALRNHRVGKDRRNSWPCPGEEITHA